MAELTGAIIAAVKIMLKDYKEKKTMMKLENADLCINCETVFDARNNEVCPKCGSAAVYKLFMWFGLLSNIKLGEEVEAIPA